MNKPCFPRPSSLFCVSVWLLCERPLEHAEGGEEFIRSVWGLTSIASAVWLFKRENVRAAHLDGLLFPFGPQTGNPRIYTLVIYSNGAGRKDSTHRHASKASNVIGTSFSLVLFIFQVVFWFPERTSENSRTEFGVEKELSVASGGSWVHCLPELDKPTVG